MSYETQVMNSERSDSFSQCQGLQQAEILVYSVSVKKGFEALKTEKEIYIN